jgi:hypothetical protein
MNEEIVAVFVKSVDRKSQNTFLTWDKLAANCDKLYLAEFVERSR